MRLHIPDALAKPISFAGQQLYAVTIFSKLASDGFGHHSCHNFFRRVCSLSEDPYSMRKHSIVAYNRLPVGSFIERYSRFTTAHRGKRVRESTMALPSTASRHDSNDLA